MKFDDIITSLGDFGAYQKRIYIMVCLASMFCGIQVMLSVFTQAVPDHRCDVSGYTNDTNGITSDEHAWVVNFSIPFEELDGGRLRVSQCSVGILDQASGNITEETCKSWVYDRSIYHTTVTTKFNLVCEYKTARSHATMILMAGFLIGAITTGVIADTIGRKIAFLIMVVLNIATSIGVAFADSLIVYLILRFLIGLSLSGYYLAVFVLGMELVGPSTRMIAGIVMNIAWAIGAMLLGCIAYFIRDCDYLQLAVSFPALLLLSYCWLLPESPRWLLVRGRDEKAEAIIRHVAKVNGVTMPEKLFDDISLDETKTQESIWKIFTSPIFFLRLVIMCYNWLTASMVFYGLSLNSGNLSGNIYINFELMILAEIVAQVICLLVLNRAGRKIAITAFMIIGGSACLCTIFTVLFAGGSLQWTTIALALVGKCGASAAFAIVYIYSAELFPTVLRNSLLGVTSVFARIGGMICPYIADLSAVVDGEFGQVLPLVIFGSSTVFGGLLCLLLPETLNRNLPETLEDAINLERIQNKFYSKQNEQDTELSESTSDKERKPLTWEGNKLVNLVEK